MLVLKNLRTFIQWFVTQSKLSLVFTKTLISPNKKSLISPNKKSLISPNKKSLIFPNKKTHMTHTKMQMATQNFK